jgi:Ni,Fe-hydrogenase III large subunit/Ni,Fe-hydrogenase III component G
MYEIISELEKDFPVKRLRADEADGLTRSTYLAAGEDHYPEILGWLSRRELRLAGLWAAEDFEGHPGFSLLAVFEKPGASGLLTLVVRLKGRQVFSMAARFPAASYYEREIQDGFGIEFKGGFDNRRLFLHDVYPDDFHPLLKSFRNRPLELDYASPAGSPYPFRECEGEGVYQVPVGPVHAGIIEPGHFRFSVIGETIFALEIRHFYKHRGLEKLAEGRAPAQCMAIAEAVSGDESAANSFALAMALETVSGVTPPRRAGELRTILLELERIYSHLGDLAGMATDVAYPLGASPLYALREEILRWNAGLTGSRFLKGMIIAGGLRRDIPPAPLSALSAFVSAFPARLEHILAGIYGSAWVIDRFETTGVIPGKLVSPLNLSGPTARASGADMDTRRDHPYGIYAELRMNVPVKQEGDVLARFQVKAEEIRASVLLIRDVLSRLEEGAICAPCLPRDGYALALVESARGQNLHWIYVKNGLVARYKVRTASFSNWPAIEHAVMGNIPPDFPLINKSLNLSYAGNDL